PGCHSRCSRKQPGRIRQGIGQACSCLQIKADWINFEGLFFVAFLGLP
ncbi:MAG: hypothetical protein ACI87H_003120, partial [Gammaproteobacteria bacterium]